MPVRALGDFKYLFHLTLWNIIFAIVCIPTAGKLIDCFGVPLSISIFYFPFIYVISDVLTEVYGYVIARHVLWYNIAAQIFATIIFQFVAYYPPSAIMNGHDAFALILKAAPRIVFFGITAMFMGDIANNYVLAKMKVWSKGKNMAARFIASTVAGETVNTAFFYIFALWGILPSHALWFSIAMGSAIKIIVEIVLLPFSLWLSNYLKHAEQMDFYDTNTDFNPLKF